jgi:hypothetical protein
MTLEGTMEIHMERGGRRKSKGGRVHKGCESGEEEVMEVR